MGNLCSTPKVTQIIECVQQLQQVELTLGHLIDKYDTQIREQQSAARTKRNDKYSCLRHVRTIHIIRHHKQQLEKRQTACLSKRYQLESLNVTQMHLQAIRSTSATFEHFLKEHDVNRVAAIQDTLAEMIEDACEINDMVSTTTPLEIDDSDIEDEYNSLLAEVQTPIVFPSVPQTSVGMGDRHDHDSELVPLCV